MGDVLGGQPARLTQGELDTVMAYAARANWPAGFAIYERGGQADGVFLVSRGRVVLRSRVRAGRGFVPWIATHGETFGAEGLVAGSRYATDAKADEETETLFLSSARFRAFVREQPQPAIALLNQLMAERTALLEKLRELTTLSVEQRLLTAMIRLATNETFTRDDGALLLDTSRFRLVCELVGATRESVSLVLGKLTGQGLVERKGTNLIVAPTAQLLKRLDTVMTNGDLTLGGSGPTADQAIQ